MGPPKISETTRGRMLKLKTQLDIAKCSLWVKKLSAMGRPGGIGPPSVNFGRLDPLISRKVQELES